MIAPKIELTEQQAKRAEYTILEVQAPYAERFFGHVLCFLIQLPSGRLATGQMDAPNFDPAQLDSYLDRLDIAFANSEKKGMFSSSPDEVNLPGQ